MQVLDKLRHFAKQEAELLFREFSNFPGALPYFSERISNAINVARDQLTTQLQEPSQDMYAQLLPLFRDHLPPTVARLGFDHIRERVPPAYIVNAFASCLASHIVYREGTHFIESAPRDKLAATCISYIRQERLINQLKQKLEGGQLSSEDLQLVTHILDVGGARSLLFRES